MSPAFDQTVAILGGTGRSGPGIALRLARAGVDVIIGSRDHGRADDAAAQVRQRLGDSARVRGASNSDAAQDCRVAMVTVPYTGVADLVTSLRSPLVGKAVISTVVPLAFGADRRPTHLDVAAGSAAEEIAALLPESSVTAALHTVSSAELARLEDPLDADTIVLGDDPGAVATTAQLIDLMGGLRPVTAGGLYLARYAEHLTVLLLSINRRYKVNAGVRITHLNAARS